MITPDTHIVNVWADDHACFPCIWLTPHNFAAMVKKRWKHTVTGIPTYATVVDGAVYLWPKNAGYRIELEIMPWRRL